MNKLSLSKQKILILAISAIVVIGGSVAAVAIFRNNDKAKEDTTTSATVQQQVEETYFADAPVFVTDEDNSTVTDPSGNALTTLKRVVRTTKKVANNKATTKKAAATAAAVNTTKNPNKEDKLVDQVIGDDGKQFAGYRYNSAGDYYYTDDKDCWQKGAGYNEVYDNMAPAAGMFIDQVRIRFNYGGKDWMIQFWKGQYGFLLVGAEIGVYTAPSGTYKGDTSGVNHYNCADKADWLNMQLDCYWSKNNDGHYKKIFTREYGPYWWATGFVKGQLTKYTVPKTELKVKGRITFKSTEMANLFVYGLRESGFVRAGGSDQLVDDSYYQKGADVWVLWSTVYHDCFVEQEGSAEPVATQAPATTKAVTTTKAAETTVKATEPETTEAVVTSTEAAEEKKEEEKADTQTEDKADTKTDEVPGEDKDEKTPS